MRRALTPERSSCAYRSPREPLSGGSSPLVVRTLGLFGGCPARPYRLDCGCLPRGLQLLRAGLAISPHGEGRRALAAGSSACPALIVQIVWTVKGVTRGPRARRPQESLSEVIHTPGCRPGQGGVPCNPNWRRRDRDDRRLLGPRTLGMCSTAAKVLEATASPPPNVSSGTLLEPL
jgi:hypothetical protein